MTALVATLMWRNRRACRGERMSDKIALSDVFTDRAKKGTFCHCPWIAGKARRASIFAFFWPRIDGFRSSDRWTANLESVDPVVLAPLANRRRAADVRAEKRKMPKAFCIHSPAVVCAGAANFEPAEATRPSVASPFFNAGVFQRFKDKVHRCQRESTQLRSEKTVMFQRN